MDAVVTNTEQAQFWVTNFHEHKLVGKPYPIAVGYGIMSKLNNTDLMDQINEALMSMRRTEPTCKYTMLLLKNLALKVG